MAKTNANTQSSTQASSQAAANSQPADMFGGAEVNEEFFKSFVPQAFHGINQSSAGIKQLLTMGGVPGDKIATMMSDPDGATQLNSVLSDAQFQAAVAKRLTLKPDGSQVSEKPAKGEKTPPKKDPTLPKPQSPAPQTEGVKSFMGIAGAASKIGGQRGGPLKMVREKITPDGGRVTVTEYYEPGPGDTLSPVGREVSDAAGNVVASEGTTDSSDGKKDEKPAKPPRRTIAERIKKENRPTFNERLEENLQGFEKRGGSPNLANQAAIAAGTGAQHVVGGAAAMVARNWPAALATASGLGAAKFLLGSGTSQPTNQPPTAMDPAQYMSLFGTQPQPPQGQAPQPPVQPQPKANPAGPAPDGNTTLMQLQRLMQSREYA